MKLLITLLLPIWICQTAFSQEISTGLRTGITRAQDVKQLKQGAIRHTWDKEIYLRLETNKKLAFEIYSTQYYYQEADPYYQTMLICWPSEEYYKYDRLYQINHMNMIDIGISAQYSVFNNMNSCRIFKNIDNYIGVNAVYTHANIKRVYHKKSTETGEQVSTETRENIPYNLHFGLSNTLIYRFSKIYISGTGSFLLSPVLFEDDGWLPITHNNSITARIGIGYTF